MTTRLESIIRRERTMRARDLIFAAGLALAAIGSLIPMIAG